MVIVLTIIDYNMLQAGSAAARQQAKFRETMNNDHNTNSNDDSDNSTNTNNNVNSNSSNNYNSNINSYVGAKSSANNREPNRPRLQGIYNMYMCVYYIYKERERERDYIYIYIYSLLLSKQIDQHKLIVQRGNKDPR